jgi:hypothetical protein
MTTISELREQVRGHPEQAAQVVEPFLEVAGVVIVSAWEDPAQDAAATQWVRDYYDAVHPHSGAADDLAGPGELRRDLRPAAPGEGGLRPGQLLPPQPEHRAGEPRNRE